MLLTVIGAAAVCWCVWPAGGAADPQQHSSATNPNLQQVLGAVGAAPLSEWSQTLEKTLDVLTRTEQ